MKVKLKKSLALLLALLMALSTMTTLAMADDETPDPATCEHEWVVSWDWSDDYSTCTATRVCSICHLEEGPEEAAVSSTVTQPGTCTEPGSRTVRAEVVFDGTDTYVTDGIAVETPANGHVWSTDVTFTWSDDYSSATASRACVCEDCDGDCQCEPWTIDADVASEETTAPTCTEPGVMTYTATADFGDGVTGTDTETSEIEATGHTWGEEVTWTWSPDKDEITYGTDPDSVTVTATRNCVCDCCGLVDCTCDPDVADVEIAYDVTPPTCEEDGYATYIATATFSDGTEDTDELVVTDEDSATGHEWGVPEFTWSEDYSSATATRTCKICGDKESKDATVSEVTTPATCTTDGETVYTAEVVFDGITYTDTKTVEIEATGHIWGDEITWTWTPAEITAETDPDDVSATATRVCEKCGEPETIDAEVTPAITEATCTTDGEVVYTATATFDGETEPVTDTLTVVLPALGHDWSGPDWDWAEDYSSAEATFTCNRCGTSETVDAVVSSVVTTEPTCTEKGEETYTATVDFNDETYTDIKTSEIDALGHNFDIIEWHWASDYGAASVTFTCSRCGYTDTEIAEVTPVITEPTCTEGGYTTYYATTGEIIVDGRPYIFNDKEVGNETPALGHDWGTTEWTWDPDPIPAYTDPEDVSAEATRKCQRDGCGAEESAEATITLVETPATCTQAGEEVYTATATFDGETDPVTDEKIVALDPLGHDWGDPEWTWDPAKDDIDANTDPDDVTAKVSRTCQRCGAEESAEATVDHDITDPTCTEDGQIDYTATATFDGETEPVTDEVTVVLEALGHEWGTTEWTWNPDPITAETDPETVTAEASRTCQRDGCGETETKPATVTYVNDYVEPKCTTDGSITYTATVTFDGETDAETATYGPIDLPATGHEWSKVTDDSWVWSDDYTVAVVYRECLKCGAIEINNATVTKEVIDPTCTVDGKTVFTGTVTIDDEIYTNVQEPESMIEPATGHTWGTEITWTWSPDKDDITPDTDPDTVTATATRECVCENCGDECDCGLDYAVVTVDYVVTDPTCTEDGYITYTAEALFEEDGVMDSQELVVVNEGSATGHTWGDEITWTWSPDKDDITSDTDPDTVTATATRECVCESCGDECDCELYYADVTVSYVVTDPTCTEDGYITYTAEAVFDDGVTASQGLEVVFKGTATGHTYGDVEWIWDPEEITEDTDPETVTAVAVRTCKDCGEQDKEDAVVTYERTAEPDCENTGLLVYTATAYFNGVKYTDEKDVVLAALGHTWGEVTWSKVQDKDSDTPTITASRTCEVCGKIETSGILEVTKVVTEATCTENGQNVYTAEWVYDENGEPLEGGPFNFKETDITDPATGHTWGSPVINWDPEDITADTNPDSVTAKAVRTCECSNCGDTCECDPDEVDAEVTYVFTKETCEVDGSIVYTASATFEDGTKATDTYTVEIPAEGHVWGDVEFNWTDFNLETGEGTVTASRTCMICGKTEDAVAEVTSVITTEPTCTVDGLKIYTAVAEFDGKEYTDTAEEVLPALGHEWSDPEFDWSDFDLKADAGTVTASRVCTRCNAEDPSNPYTATVVKDESSVEPTCTEAGQYDYTATVEIDGTEYTDSKTAAIEALGHEWGEPTWTWSTNYTIASATFVCERCNRAESAIAVVTSETTEPTCTTAGEVVYNASVTFDGVKYDAEPQVVVIPATGHTYGDVEFVWSDDYSSATATRTCEVCKYVDTANVTVSSVTTDPTCTEVGQTVYTATATFGDGTTATDTKTVVLDALGHDWGEQPTWMWSNNYSVAEAAFTCERCGRVETAIAFVTSETTEPTCTADGQTVYTATATFNGKQYVDKMEVTLDALGHTYGAVEFVWSDDYSSATATRTCEVCKYVDTANVTVSSVTTDPTCTETGQTVYTATATFSDDTTATDTKTVAIDALGHEWGSPNWIWNANYSVAEVQFTCARCNTVESSLGVITSVTTNPSCTEAGKIVYTATATFNGKQYTDTEEVAIPATGHTYGAVEFVWSDDYSSATATRTCEACGEEETVNATVNSVTTEPTNTQAGQTVYTATATFSDGTVATATKTVVIPALGEPDTTELTAEIAEAEALNKEDYTEESWADLQAALAAAEAVLRSDTATQADINAAADVLSDAIASLVPAKEETEANKEALDIAIEAAYALDESEYTADSWASLQSALSAAETVCNDSSATQSQVNEALDALLDAIAALVKSDTSAGTDKTTLDVVISATEEMVSSDYTSESWAVVEEALNAAKNVMDDPNATQEQVNEAFDALEEAINALVKADTGELFTGFKLNSADGNWYYYIDSEIAYGLNSVLEGTVNGSNGWWYVVNGQVQLNYTGVCNYCNDYGWWYVKNGKVDFSCNSVEHNDYGWWYVLGGKVDFSYTGVANYANAYGWWYINAGKVDFSKTSIEPNQYGWWRVVDGKVDFSCNSVEKNDYGWWYVVGGKVDFSYTGVANYANAYGWWYINAGKVDFSKTSIEPNQYGWWRVVNGKVDFSCNSVEQNDYGWWYVVGGQVQFNYTGVANYANAYGWWYIKAGKVDFSFTGWATNNYGRWYCVNGKVDFSKS